MARDDSSLYSGITSVSAGVVREKRAEVKQDSKEVMSKLKPALELITKLIDKEKSKIRNIEYFDVENIVLDEVYKAELMARKKYMGYLSKLQVRVDKAFKEYNS